MRVLDGGVMSMIMGGARAGYYFLLIVDVDFVVREAASPSSLSNS
jgi:hypothetical protein